jgi:hypothetical protein
LLPPWQQASCPRAGQKWQTDACAAAAAACGHMWWWHMSVTIPHPVCLQCLHKAPHPYNLL